jgi:lipopolysaccharide transport system ATP-binding protein
MGSIQVTGLSKAYKQYFSRWSRLAEWVWPSSGPRHNTRWVLQDINFGVRPGEAVGIVGVNGAGKSTLLKLITGTTQPTAGSVAVTGSLAALLELGMGFHADFTGRQNVFMTGQLLGMTSDEIAQLFPQIEAFAEIGDYIDQPLRVYSSGMQVRLAFSVATARRPDILIVDEALSVGDAYFQHKSFGRIREFRNSGTTLLIVSHDRQAIQSLCSRVILLDGGKLTQDGEPEVVLDYYNAMLASRQNQAVEQRPCEDGRVQTISGTAEAQIEEIGLYTAGGDQARSVCVGEPLELRVRVKVNADLPELVFGYQIRDRLGHVVYGTNTYYLDAKLTELKKGEIVTYSFKFPANLGPASYSISAALHASNAHVVANYEWRDLSIVFTVVNVGHPDFIGTAWLPPELEYSRG